MGRLDRLSKSNVFNIAGAQPKTKPSARHNIPKLHPDRYHDERRRTVGRPTFQSQLIEKTRKTRIWSYPVAIASGELCKSAELSEVC